MIHDVVTSSAPLGEPPHWGPDVHSCRRLARVSSLKAVLSPSLYRLASLKAQTSRVAIAINHKRVRTVEVAAAQSLIESRPTVFASEHRAYVYISATSALSGSDDYSVGYSMSSTSIPLPIPFNATAGGHQVVQALHDANATRYLTGKPERPSSRYQGSPYLQLWALPYCCTTTLSRYATKSSLSGRPDPPLLNTRFWSIDIWCSVAFWWSRTVRVLFL